MISKVDDEESPENIADMVGAENHGFNRGGSLDIFGNCNESQKFCSRR